MFSEPFKSDLACLITTTGFLLRHHSEEDCLWTESLEDSWTPHRVYSLWATADIMLSLLEVAEYFNENKFKNKYKAATVEIDNLKEKIASAVEKTSKSLLRAHNQIQDYADSQKERDLEALRDTADVGVCHKSLVEVVREIMGYYGLPRSYNPSSVEFSDRGMWGSTNIIASCYVYIALDGISADSLSMNIKEWQKAFSDHVVRPELGLLRKSLRQLDPEYRAARSNSDSMDADFNKYWNDLRIKYKENTQSSSLNQIDSFPANPSEGRKKIAVALCKLVKEEFDRGVLWSDDEDNSGGWMSVPLQTGAGIDPVATLSVLEVISAIPKSSDLTEKAKAKFVDAFELGMSFLEDTVASAMIVKCDWQDELQKDRKLAERWPLGLMCRFVMALSFIEQRIGYNALSEVNCAKAKAYKDRAHTLNEIMYTALLVKVFRTVVEVRSPPYESVPVALISGNEISHWPGLDTGLVAVALLRGWECYNWEEAASNYAILRDLRHRVCPPYLYRDDEKPLLLPIFYTVICMVKQQIVGHHNACIVAQHLAFRGRPAADDSTEDLLGAFLSSSGLAPGREFNPSVYLWATAHALSALVNWRKKADGETDWVTKELDSLEKKHQKELDSIKPHRIFAPFSRSERLLWQTMAFIGLPWLISFLAVPFVYYDWFWTLMLPLGVVLPPFVWYVKLRYLLCNRAKRAGAHGEAMRLMQDVFAIVALAVAAIPSLVFLALLFYPSTATITQIIVFFGIMIFIIMWVRHGYDKIRDRIMLALHECWMLLFQDPEQYDWKNAKERFTKMRSPYSL